MVEIRHIFSEIKTHCNNSEGNNCGLSRQHFWVLIENNPILVVVYTELGRKLELCMKLNLCNTYLSVFWRQYLRLFFCESPQICHFSIKKIQIPCLLSRSNYFAEPMAALNLLVRHNRQTIINCTWNCKIKYWYKILIFQNFTGLKI